MEAYFLGRHIRLMVPPETWDWPADLELSSIHTGTMNTSINVVFEPERFNNRYLLSKGFFEYLSRESGPVKIIFIWRDSTGRRELIQEVIIPGLGSYYLR
jgi:hypothetical protein